MLRKIHWVISAQLGIDPLIFIKALKGIPKYIFDLRVFKKSYQGRLQFMPCLHDWNEEGGSTKSEYFWQDLLVARMILEVAPVKHVDIGSRVDGFVAHIASARDIEVFDVRPISTHVPGIKFRQADLMLLPPEMTNYCDSLSCLHALEHFGLGRYGDPINPDGYRFGLKNMSKLLSPGGRLYLSVPIGIERVEFNANRVFDPRTILSIADSNGLRVIKMQVIMAVGGFKDIEPTEPNLKILADAKYTLGIFVFQKH